MPLKIFDNIAELCSNLTSEPLLPVRVDTNEDEDWFQNELSSDRRHEDFTDMKKHQKKKFREKVVNELKKEMTYDKIRHRYTQMHSKPFTYDPVIYGQFAVGSGIVQNRLIDIYGDNVLYLQDPQYSQKCLRLYKKWKDGQEEIREGQRLIRAYEVDKRGALSALREKEKSKIEKQLGRFKHLKAGASRSKSESIVKDEDSTLSFKLEEKRVSSGSPDKSVNRKYKYGNLTLQTNQRLIRRLDETEVKKLYEKVDVWLDQENTFFPEEHFTLGRKKKEEEKKKNTNEEEKSHKFSSSSIKEKILNTFKSSDPKELKRVSFSEFHDFSEDVSGSLFMD